MTAGLVDQFMVEAEGTVRGELARVDGKASTLLALATGGLAVLAAAAPGRLPDLPVAAVVGVWVAGGLLAVTIGLLLAAVRPQLASQSGPIPGTFVAFAAAGDAAAVVGQVCEAVAGGQRHQAAVLRGLSQLTCRKYQRLRWACHLLLAALVVLAAAAVLAQVGGAR